MLIAAAGPTGEDDSSRQTSGGNAATTSRSGREGLLEADGPIAQSLRKAAGTLEDTARAIPPALFAMALLAVALLAVASMPQFGNTSRAAAMLVHKRASIAAAGGATLATAIATYLLLITL
jgi:hypothetical protein